MIKIEKKETCYFCLKELYYTECQWYKRGWDAQPKELEAKKILDYGKCSELEVQLLVENIPINKPQTILAHKECLEPFLKNKKEDKLPFKHYGRDGYIKISIR